MPSDDSGPAPLAGERAPADELDTGRCFRVIADHGVGWGASAGLLDGRERALITGALNVHCLLHPTETIRAVVLRGPADRLPSLTGAPTMAATWPSDSTVIASVVVENDSLESRANPRVTKTIIVDLGGGEASGSNYGMVSGRGANVRKALRTRVPVLYDAARQLSTDRTERVRRPVIGGAGAVLPMTAMARLSPSDGAPVAVLFGMNWLELGGAEKWAFETVTLARAMDAVPIVVTDRDSPHPLATHPAMRDAVFLPLTLPLLPGQDADLLQSIMSRYDVRLVHVHHCLWLYERLPWLRATRPDVLIVDSLHIREWRHGGFVTDSLRQTSVIDKHHVISPALRDELLKSVRPDKVEMRPLLDLGQHIAAPAVRRSEGPLTVGFVARLTQQKRPFLFFALAARLRRRLGGGVRFVVHGDGYLSEETERLMRRYGLAECVTTRTAEDPVADSYAESDVLVISSDAEGLTLTALEAARAGCLVMSTDVGSQRTVVADELLLPRHPHAYLRRGVDLILRLKSDPVWFEALLAEQSSKHEELAGSQGAREWAAQLYGSVLSH